MAESTKSKAAKAAASGDGEGEGESEETPAKTKKDPKPEGYVSPVEFAKLWSAHRAGQPATLEAFGELDEGQVVRPQIIYGYIRNNAAFHEACAMQNTDGHWMINTQSGLDFLTQRDSDRAAKASAKAASEAESQS